MGQNGRGSCCQSGLSALEQGCWYRCGAAVVSLHGAARRCCCALWSRNPGAADGCRCRVLLARAWSGHAGAAAVFRCQLRLQGAARRCWYQSGARALEQACWCHCRVPLQGMLGIAQGRTINSKRSS